MQQETDGNYANNQDGTMTDTDKQFAKKAIRVFGLIAFLQSQ